jgi:hypothetical protein
MQIGPALNDTAAETGPFMTEEIPAPNVYINHRNIVHFDLDPQNIFIFDSDNNHRKIPVFKVSFHFRPLRSFISMAECGKVAGYLN